MEKSKNVDLEKQKAIQKKYLELQILSQQLKQVEKQIEAVESQILEVLTIVQSLDDFKQTKPNSKSLAPIANGIFVETKLESTQSLLVNIGGNVVVKKSVDETKEMLETQLEELRAGEKDMLEQFQMLSLKAQEIQVELNDILA